MVNSAVVPVVDGPVATASVVDEAVAVAITTKQAILFGVGIGIGIGLGIGACVVGYKCYQNHVAAKNAATKASEDEFAKRLRTKKEQKARWASLIEGQVRMDVVTITQLLEWFRENRDQFADTITMFVVEPTKEHLRGMGFDSSATLDETKNVIQMFYDTERNTPAKVRLVSYEEMESNLQAHLIEDDGMLPVVL